MRLEKDQQDLTLKVEEYRAKEREWREKISDDAREMEKTTNKQVMLISLLPFIGNEIPSIGCEIFVSISQKPMLIYFTEKVVFFVRVC